MKQRRARWVVWVSWLVLQGMALPGGVAAEEASPGEVSLAETVPPSAVERQLLQDLYEQHGLDGRADEPDVSLYLQDLGRAFGDRLTSWLDRHLGTFASATSAIIGPVAYGLLLLLAVVSLTLWGRILWRRRAGSQVDDPSLQRLDKPRPAGGAHGAVVAWEAQLRRFITAGDVPRAVEALWWWLAEALGTVADGAWTSRELVQHAGRRDLMPQVRRLDRLIYGSGQPSIGEVSGLWHDLQSEVATAQPPPRQTVPRAAEPAGAEVGAGLSDDGERPLR